jgi:hypothetical protein
MMIEATQLPKIIGKVGFMCAPPSTTTSPPIAGAANALGDANKRAEPNTAPAIVFFIFHAPLMLNHKKTID